MTQVNIHEAKTHLSKLVARAMAGEEIVIARAGKPMVRLVIEEPQPKTRRVGGFLKNYEIPDDAFAPMTEEELDLWYK
jgi:prevent-host-death family protein